jgi:hypothetical protein
MIYKCFKMRICGEFYKKKDTKQKEKQGVGGGVINLVHWTTLPQNVIELKGCITELEIVMLHIRCCRRRRCRRRLSF